MVGTSAARLWAVAPLLTVIVQGFTSPIPRHQRYSVTLSATTEPSTDYWQEQLDDIPQDLGRLFGAVSNATLLKNTNTGVAAHDDFRYEWGTWCNESNIEFLMNRIDEVRLMDGVYELNHVVDDDDYNSPTATRCRVARGKNWDCVLYLLPRNAEWRDRKPSGSWTICKALIGQVEIAALSGPDRDGLYKRKTKKALWGGGGGSIGGGGVSSGGMDCIKYVGGPLRSYVGTAGRTVMMEIGIRPPISGLDHVEDIQEINGDIQDVLAIVEAIPEPEPLEEEVKPVVSVKESAQHLGNSMGMSFDKVGGLDAQLDSIARRVLASRANPEAAKKLGVSHVRGILLSGPPGCGKTLLARELASLLDAREPQIVNGPDILDKFIGEAEKNIRALFAPAELEYREAGDNSALHIIILDEMDAIARKRGSMASDSTGVRDSVVNQLLAKMDGVKEATNILVVGLTNRPELLDPALLRPGRLEVHLRVELPDLPGRRDILRIHTRRMKEAGGLSKEALSLVEDVSEHGLAGRSEHFTGAELAGLVRSAASFALARTINSQEEEEGQVIGNDLEKALDEVRPALGKQDEVLKMRFPFGVSSCSPAMTRIKRDLKRFIAPSANQSPRLESTLLVGAGGGSGVTALAAWAAAEASSQGSSDFVRLVTALDLLGGDDDARAASLVDKFSEASELSHALLVLDDVDQLCAGSGPGGYSSVMLASLRALLRSPPSGKSTSREGSKTLQIIATTSRSDAACRTMHEIFDETIAVPFLSQPHEVEQLLSESFPVALTRDVAGDMASQMVERIGRVGCKTALRLTERAIAASLLYGEGCPKEALTELLDDVVIDAAAVDNMCQVF